MNEAARTLAYATDVGWRRVAAANAAVRADVPAPAPARVRPPRRIRSGSRWPRTWSSQNGEVVLARDADPWADPVLLLRVARAAAAADLPISPYALTRLATEAGPLPEPWPAAARAEFVALLGTGTRALARWRRWTSTAC